MRYGVFVERHRALIYSYYSASTFEQMEMLGWNKRTWIRWYWAIDEGKKHC